VGHSPDWRNSGAQAKFERREHSVRDQEFFWGKYALFFPNPFWDLFMAGVVDTIKNGPA
jgi:hypothetical protein